VAGLSQGLEDVQRARAAAEAQLHLSGLLRAAILGSVFSDASSKWPVVALESVSEIVSGVTLGRRPPVAPTRSVPYLTVANVKDGRLALQDVRAIEITDAELAKWRLEDGDLLLTEGGDADKLGRGTLWRQEIESCIHQNHIFRIRFRRHEVLPVFADAQVSSPYGKAYFFRHAKQTTGIATINQRVLRAFPLLCPPLADQHQVVAELKTQLARAEHIQAQAHERLRALDYLPAALLRQAFSGEL
jgi:type I restriction enzyme S subunit